MQKLLKRKNRENQLPLNPIWPEHRLADELLAISEILDDNPRIPELVLQVSSDIQFYGLRRHPLLRVPPVLRRMRRAARARGATQRPGAARSSGSGQRLLQVAQAVAAAP